MWHRLNPSTRGGIVVAAACVLVLALVWAAMEAGGSESASRSGGGSTTTVSAGKVTETAVVSGSEEHSVVFAVPGGVVGLELRLGTEAGYAPEVRPPRGGMLIKATVEKPDLDALARTPDGPAAGLDPKKLPASTVWLRSGTFRARLFDAMRPLTDHPRSDDAPSTVIAMPRTDAPILLELQFDGRRQTVDLRTGERHTGAFAALYRPPHQERTGTDDRGLFHRADRRSQQAGDLRWSSSADVRYRRVPYLQGLGWAAAGREWLVVDDGGLRASSIVDRDSPSEEYPRHTLRIVRDKGSGSLTADGARVARHATTKLTASRSVIDEGSEDTETASYRVSNVVLDAPTNRATTVTLSLRVPLASPRTDTMRVRRSLVIPAAPRLTGADR